jgi:carboxyl-terminal processing protease
MEDGRIAVVSPIEGTPAARAGIRPGDVILSIDGKPIDDSSIADTISRMRGRAGSHVLISIARAGRPEPLAFDLVRSNVRVRSVRATMLEPGYGYVRVTQFSDTTAADLRKELASLRVSSGKLRGVLLDLRNNPGGVLDAAVETADLFLDEGVIVTASGRTPDATFAHDATPGDVLDGAPLVVLVNGGSASASEIVAGALKDNSRATIVGHRTFGKGSVQTVMPLSDGHAIKLTTSRYYTPSGASIQGSGITPDVVLADDAELRRASVFSAAPATDAEVRKALDLLRAAAPLQARTR